jgi:hypothetical protein
VDVSDREESAGEPDRSDEAVLLNPDPLHVSSVSTLRATERMPSGDELGSTEDRNPPRTRKRLRISVDSQGTRPLYRFELS